MPGKERLQKRKDQYEKLYRVFGNIQTNDPYAEDKQALREALRVLNEKIAALTAGNDAREKKLSPEQIDEMMTAYGNTMNALDKLLKDMNTGIKTLEAKDAKNKRDRRALKTLKSEAMQYDLIADTLGKDLGAFRQAKKDDKSLSMYELYETSRVDSSYKLKEGQQIEFASGDYNTRIKLTITDKDNHEIEGYFTEEEQEFLTREAAQEKAFEKNRKKYGDAGAYFSFDKFKKIVDAMGSAVGAVADDDFSNESFNDAVNFFVKKTGGGYDMRRILNTPEKLRAFVNMVKDHTDLDSHYNLMKSMGISEKSHINRRNAAMSGMADLLGCGNILAHSQNIKININGEEKKGTFMKKAEGEDANKAKFDSDLSYVTYGSTENLNLKKQVADLQILDFICGNPDRHAGNMFYITEKDENGKIMITGIKGIDNDTSFGSEDLFKQDMREIKLKDMKVITRQMADKVLALNRETLVQMFYGYELSEKEIDNMVGRVEELQSKIRDDDRFYAQGFAKGVLFDNRIKIVDDEEMNALSFRDDLACSDIDNLFKRVKEMTPGTNNLKDCLNNYKSDYEKSVKEFTSDTMMDFVNSMESIASDDKKLQTGSPQYTAMRNATKDVLDAMRKYTGPHIDEDYDGTKIMNEKLTEIKSKIDAAITACEAYKTYKHERNIRERKPDFDPRPHKLSRAERRWQNVEKNVSLLRKQKALFEKMQAELQAYDKAFKRFPDLMEERLNAEKKEPAVDRERILDQRTYDNYKSRCRYLVLDEAMAAKNAVPGSAEQKEHDLLYKVKLGYALKVLEPDDAAKLREDLEKATKTKIEGSNEKLFKEALGYEFIYHKYHLQNVEKERELEFGERDLKNRIEQVVEIEGGNVVEAYEKFIKSDAFEYYFEDVSKTLDINHKRNAEEKKNSEGKHVNKVSTTLMEHIDPMVKVYGGYDFDRMVSLLREKIQIVYHIAARKKMEEEENRQSVKSSGRLSRSSDNPRMPG